MLINVSNHPSALWPSPETAAAVQEYGSVIDYPFPNIDPEAQTGDIREMALHARDEICAMFQRKEGEAQNAVLCQGEFTFAHALTTLLQQEGIPVVAATTQRITKEYVEDGVPKKESVFQFVQFRQYPNMTK